MRGFIRAFTERDQADPGRRSRYYPCSVQASGVVQATGFYPEAPNVSIMGGNSLYTNYTIDGFDNNERFLGGQKFAIPVGFARNISVLTNNFSTEYGLTGNGIIDITTRSGSNDFLQKLFI